MKMKTAQETFTNANIIEGEVGTTGPMGGDAGHGSETYIKLSDSASTSWCLVVVDDNGNESVIEQPQSVMITVQGDAELQTLTNFLEWAGNKIRELPS